MNTTKTKIAVGIGALLLIAAACFFFVTRETPSDETSTVTGSTTTSKSILGESDAQMIAQKMCIKDGETLAPGYYNENSKTWWFDANLNPAKRGCNPTCVVSEETKTAEINWRCTGAILPVPTKETPKEITCPEKRGDVCAEIYEPVCAEVQVQCFRAPCPPIKQTFSNSCEACRNTMVSSYVKGECTK